jgi:hypothetical protein
MQINLPLPRIQFIFNSRIHTVSTANVGDEVDHGMGGGDVTWPGNIFNGEIEEENFETWMIFKF